MKQLLKLYLPLLFAATIGIACSGDDDDGGSSVEYNANRNDTSREPALQRLEFPKVKGGNSIVIIHTTNDEYGINYSVEWDCEKRSQRWSCYQMYAANRVQKTKRYYSDSNQYPFDPNMPAGSYFDYDPFWGSGFDHGHICPSADRLYNSAANIQTFYLTNMQPQHNAFNAGLWPVITTLRNGLIVPKYFFMALLRKSGTGYKALAFWAEHLSVDHSNDPLGNYVINIRELERRTGIDFFCNLPDAIEEDVENTTVENIKWLWNL